MCKFVIRVYTFLVYMRVIYNYFTYEHWSFRLVIVSPLYIACPETHTVPLSLFNHKFIQYFQLAEIVNRCIIRRTQALLTKYLPVKSECWVESV